MILLIIFESVTKGQVLATGDEEPLLSPIDGHVVFGTSTLKPASIAEEAMFITAPARKVNL
ncbi:MAG: hypothetical protein R3A13_12215 [Bdellovibrionota bacterium]